MWETWQIIAAVCVGIPVLIAAARFGLLGVLFEIAIAILSGGKGGGSSRGGGLGGGSSGGGGSSSKW
jgi:uncharacterized membrane protein YgcG